MIETTLYTVSDLNHAAASLLTHHFEVVAVTGEISNLTRPSSGHYYFSLKDDSAQIRCAFFRAHHHHLDFTLENGQEVVMHAQVSIYEPRGDYQLIVKSVQLAGLGALQIAFDRLKNKLEKAGLFDDKHKKPLPYLPKNIGVITSPTGAALQDILKVLRHRFSAIPVFVYPTAVQGASAAAEICAALAKANQEKQCDVLILARGGGSLEDLWSFNEENVAHAIFNSEIPIITGIGHQTDFTIADFVADVRAPTPSAAAETVTPDRDMLQKQLHQQQQRLLHLIQSRIQFCAAQVPTLKQLEKIILSKINNYRDKLGHYAQTLNTLSPLNVLGRGYSITTHANTGKIILSRSDVKRGDAINTKLCDGEITTHFIQTDASTQSSDPAPAPSK